MRCDDGDGQEALVADLRRDDGDGQETRATRGLSEGRPRKVHCSYPTVKQGFLPSYMKLRFSGVQYSDILPTRKQNGLTQVYKFSILSSDNI